MSDSADTARQPMTMALLTVSRSVRGGPLFGAFCSQFPGSLNRVPRFVPGQARVAFDLVPFRAQAGVHVFEERVVALAFVPHAKGRRVIVERQSGSSTRRQSAWLRCSCGVGLLQPV